MQKKLVGSTCPNIICLNLTKFFFRHLLLLPLARIFSVSDVKTALILLSRFWNFTLKVSFGPDPTLKSRLATALYPSRIFYTPRKWCCSFLIHSWHPGPRITLLNSTHTLFLSHFVKALFFIGDQNEWFRWLTLVRWRWEIISLTGDQSLCLESLTDFDNL